MPTPISFCKLSGIFSLLLFVSIAVASMACRTYAEVTRFVIESRESPAWNGSPFPGVGQYEKLRGRAFGELDPDDEINRTIHDLQFAQRNAKGKVEYEATFTIVKPIDLNHASGVLLYSVPNRGNQLLTQTFHRGGDPGDGFLYRRGHCILYSGWQGDLDERPGAEFARVPLAKNKDGASITGPVLTRFLDMREGTMTLRMPTRYMPFDLDPSKARLTRRSRDQGAIVPIHAVDWAFSDCEMEDFPGKPDPTKVSLRGGFDPKYVYELVYLAKDPLVLAVGLAATRDIVSFVRYESLDQENNSNPLAGSAKYCLGLGTSQAGNFLKTFLHLGFNTDAVGRTVFDGVNPHIAARQLPINFRFARPGGAASLYEPGSEGVLWWGSYTDEARSIPTSSLLDRCHAQKNFPKVFETFGGAEYWGLRMSPGLIGTKAEKDISLPENVRRYYFPGTSHGSGRGGFRSDGDPLRGFQLAANPNSQLETMRALFDALVAWVVDDVEPPPSQYPMLSAGDLVRPEAEAMGFPNIPGSPLPNHMLNPFLDYDFGDGFRRLDMSGTLLQPPVIRQTIPSLVPKVSFDGNEISGCASVQLRVPLGTYLGWNVKSGGYYDDQASGFVGGYIPFQRTKKDREAVGDPRLSLEERYGSHDAFVAKVRAVADDLVARRLLLKEDADWIVSEADSSDILKW